MKRFAILVAMVLLMAIPIASGISAEEKIISQEDATSTYSIGTFPFCAVLPKLNALLTNIYIANGSVAGDTLNYSLVRFQPATYTIAEIYYIKPFSPAHSNNITLSGIFLTNDNVYGVCLNGTKDGSNSVWKSSTGNKGINASYINAGDISNITIGQTMNTLSTTSSPALTLWGANTTGQCYDDEPNNDTSTVSNCYDAFGSYSDSCYAWDTTYVYENFCDKVGTQEFCNFALFKCPTGQSCYEGKCANSVSLTIATNKENCAIYSPSLSQHNYTLNTNVSISYFPISDCNFTYWLIDDNSTDIRSNFTVNMSSNHTVIAVWKGGLNTTDIGETDAGNGIVITPESPLGAVSWLNPLLSASFMLGIFNIGVAGYVTFKTREDSNSMYYGLAVFLLFFITFLMLGYYPQILWIPLILATSIIVLKVFTELRGGGGNG